MTNSITPPRELTEQWASEKCYDERDWLYELHIAARAAQWGADQELEACVELTRDNDGYDAALGLRAARRPKPPSLKKQACDALDTYIYGEPDPQDKNRTYNTSRKALETLDD